LFIGLDLFLHVVHFIVRELVDSLGLHALPDGVSDSGLDLTGNLKV
jgi:hypothetical protein